MGKEPTFPTDWNVKALNEVSIKIQDGTHFSPTLGGNEYRYITSRNIGAGRLRLDSVEMISSEEHQKIYRRCDVRFGDLLLTKDGASTGNAALNSFHDEISLLSSVAFIRSNPRWSTEEYILQYLLSTPGRKQIADAMAGNAITRLTLAKIKALMIPLPPVAEQRRIALALRDANDLIVRLERLIVKKQAIKRGMMQQLLTGESRLPGFAEPWRKATVGELSEHHRRTVDPRQASSREFEHFSVPAYDDGELPAMELGSAIGSIKFEVPCGAVLVSKLNPRIPRTWAPVRIGGDAIASTEFVVLTPKTGIHRSFLKWQLRSAQVVGRMKILATGTTGSHVRIHPRQIFSIEVTMPPEDEQIAIAKALDEVDREISLLGVRLAKARDIRQGMMQELLTGRTRLPVQEAAA